MNIRCLQGPCFCLISLLSSLLASGCGSGLKEFDTAETTGVVTCNGQPVANVRVYFAPKSTGTNTLAGKSGWDTTNEDGTFVISTYGDEDGAVIGTHNVSVGSPHAERFPDFTCDCETNGNLMLMEVEVTADGENHFEIALPPKSGGRSSRRMSNDDLEDIQEAQAEKEAGSN
ncbi:MAG: hypothetical protein KDA86_23800 [Planctomycetaceae bacterium]|nr:hypothetical protein [Planctomycetaceae bacterium]